MDHSVLSPLSGESPAGEVYWAGAIIEDFEPVAVFAIIRSAMVEELEAWSSLSRT
ncbi:MAG: hypothetical protein IPN60_18655 [Saprospiraceae bacterium]|nr:hypothetical protein [Candidatus Opimibacter skivensis]